MKEDRKVDEKSQRIARLNDTFRKALGTDEMGIVLKTQGIEALRETDQFQIFNLIKTFDNFSKANDPYSEHDFGSVEHDGNKIFWKIDYYDPSMTKGSEDPSDPEKTSRVMTIMLAHEY